MPREPTRRELTSNPAVYPPPLAVSLFCFDLARNEQGKLARDCQLTSGAIPAGCAVRSLLALKLWGVGRPSQVMAETLDEGLALFAGLNVIPKKSTLSEYTTRCDPHFTGELINRWYHAAQHLDITLGSEQSFDLDFHTIPYQGDQALPSKTLVSRPPPAPSAAY